MMAMPAPVTVMPAPVPTPAYLFGLEAVHLVPSDNGGMEILARGRQPFIFRKRVRCKRRGLRAGGQRGGARGNSKGKLQKVSAFHDISSFAFGKQHAGY
jgi:hypothetical protein